MRARLAKTQISQLESDSEDVPTTDLKTKGTKGKKRAVEEDDEVLSAARERKRVALEQSKQAAEELAAAIKDHAHLRNLGEVELFHVDFSAPKAVDRQDRSARWNPAWNGRKNFKKFRRANQSVSVGVGRAMIPLMDYKSKSAASQGIPTIKKKIDLSEEFLFMTPQTERGGKGEPSSDDFALEMTPVKARREQSSRATQRNLTRRSGQSSRQTLFIEDDASDNDLGFDD